jgi:hypothetical protein
MVVNADMMMTCMGNKMAGVCQLNNLACSGWYTVGDCPAPENVRTSSFMELMNSYNVASPPIASPLTECTSVTTSILPSALSMENRDDITLTIFVLVRTVDQLCSKLMIEMSNVVCQQF